VFLSYSKLLIVYVICFCIANAFANYNSILGDFSLSHNTRKLFEPFNSNRSQLIESNKTKSVALAILPHIFICSESSSNYTRLANVGFITKYMMSRPWFQFLAEEGNFTMFGFFRLVSVYKLININILDLTYSGIVTYSSVIDSLKRNISVRRIIFKKWFK